MPGAQPRKDFPTRVASSVARGAAVGPGQPGVKGFRRSQAQGGVTGLEWVVVEPVADIAAKGHAYISFDPA